MEILRVTPIALASIRSYVGPRATEKDREKSFMFLRVLSDPAEFEHADYHSQLVSQRAIVVNLTPFLHIILDPRYMCSNHFLRERFFTSWCNWCTLSLLRSPVRPSCFRGSLCISRQHLSNLTPAWVLLFCFGYMGIAFRHQFTYIYPTSPDSGGKLWTNFIRTLLVCMLIAEITSKCKVEMCAWRQMFSLLTIACL
jgi:hypothetical protein